MKIMVQKLSGKKKRLNNSFPHPSAFLLLLLNPELRKGGLHTVGNILKDLKGQFL